MIVRLIARGKAFGTLYLANCTPNRYSPEDVVLLELVAGQSEVIKRVIKAIEAVAVASSERRC